MNEERTRKWSFVTQIFLNGLPSDGSNCKTVEVIPSTLPQGNLGSVAPLLAANFIMEIMIGSEHQTLEYYINC